MAVIDADPLGALNQPFRELKGNNAVARDNRELPTPAKAEILT